MLGVQLMETGSKDLGEKTVTHGWSLERGSVDGNRKQSQPVSSLFPSHKITY